MADPDVFRLDLDGFDADYIEDVLGGFLNGAPSYGRRLIEIRMRHVMLDHLHMKDQGLGIFFRSVPIIGADTGFDGTVEILLADAH
jgi:hypothetical protein